MPRVWLTELTELAQLMPTPALAQQVRELQQHAFRLGARYLWWDDRHVVVYVGHLPRPEGRGLNLWV